MKNTVYPLLLFALLVYACRNNRDPINADPWQAYRKAYNEIGINKESAFRQFNTLAENSKDKQQVALAYYNMALIQSDAADYFGAQESLLSSIRSLNEDNPADRGYIASNYNELSLTSYNLQNYQASLTYGAEATRFTADPSILQHIYINQGNAYQKLRQYDSAIVSYRNAIRLTDKKGVVFARALTNMATTKWLKNPQFNASFDLRKAVKTYRREKDLWGLNSAYAHLADYYISLRPDSALQYAREMFRVAAQLKSGDDQLEALQKLGRLSDEKDVRKFFMRYQYLSDSLGSVRRAAKNQFAVIRYDVEKGKADNLRLQNENSRKEFLLFIIILTVLVAGFGSVIWYRKRKQTFKLETESRLRQDRLKISQKVHDVVANGIYRVMNEVEYNDGIDKEYLLEKLDRMYEQSRHISHDDGLEMKHDFANKVDELLKAFKKTDILLAVSGNDVQLWENINDLIKTELELILQELMVNMDKHSFATRAVINFEILGNNLLISYRDNGVGINKSNTHGMGLTNTENRIRSLQGRLIFETGEEKGFRLQITIPLT